MNKVELSRRMASRFGFTRREAGMIVEQLMDAMTHELAQGRRVEIRGLGTFGTRERKPSLGRVVKTGQTVFIPALRRIYFRPGRELKEIRVDGLPSLNQ
ncbi:integration host factor subunit beta [bacterium]|nr:integration host factor subunit beta [bacterium]